MGALKGRHLVFESEVSPLQGFLTPFYFSTQDYVLRWVVSPLRGSSSTYAYAPGMYGATIAHLRL